MSTKDYIIEVENVSFGYGNNTVLDDISFYIKKGCYTGIIGPNGGGKTTLLKLLLGLISPDKGKIKICGENIYSFKNKYEIGYVPQRVAQNHMDFPATVEEIISSGRTGRIGLLHMITWEDQKQIEYAMKLTDTVRFRHRLISELSGGERQKVFVGRALASNPKILILDEPFTGIDISSQQEFYSFLKILNEKQNLTILFVSHDIDVISNEVKEILCLNKRIACHGKPHEILETNLIEELYGKKITHIHHNQ